MRTVFLAHAAEDREFARELSDFLEFGCDVTCYLDAGLLSPGQDLIDKAEEGLASDVLVLMLSAASCPARWPRDRWEPVLFEQAADSGVEMVYLLLGECAYPPLLKRRLFLDATHDPRDAMRRLKRRIWGHSPSGISADLEEIYRTIADHAGVMEVAGEHADRFAREAEHDFEAVMWIPCEGRSLAQAAGELGGQLGLRLEATASANSARIREFLKTRRCLVVLDAPSVEVASALEMKGRTSTLRTREAARPMDIVPPSVRCARELSAAGRYAEAYEMFYTLLDAWVDTETCARELTWICEQWDRAGEAAALRLQYSRGGEEQLSLF